MTTIKEELAAYTANLVARTGADAAAILFDGQIGQARTIVNGVLDKGQQAPSFELPDADGKLITLASRLKKGSVVLTFYRGGWCPYCNIALRALQSHLPEIKRHGGSLVAISPERPDQSLSTREKLELGFDVLSDHDNAVARRFGLVYRVSDAARQRLLVLGRDLVAHNGSQTWELPITATYVVNPKGLIVFAHVDADYRDRLEPTLIVEALRGDTSSIRDGR
jgi:peroxiredoxin